MSDRPQEGPSVQAMECLRRPSHSPGYDEEELSSTKIAPLDSPQKQKTEHTHGVIGDDYILESTHLDPLPHEGVMSGPSQHGGHHIAHHERRDHHGEHHKCQDKQCGQHHGKHQPHKKMEQKPKEGMMKGAEKKME